MSGADRNTVIGFAMIAIMHGNFHTCAISAPLCAPVLVTTNCRLYLPGPSSVMTRFEYVNLRAVLAVIHTQYETEHRAEDRERERERSERQ